MSRIVRFVVIPTVVAAAAVVWMVRALDPDGVVFAFGAVWIPMVWLGTASRVVRLRLPDAWHRLRLFERDGRVHEMLGVRVVKRLLRRGPIALFNPGLHLPSERTPEQLARLEQRMCEAEASHAVLFVVTLGVVANAASHGWWAAVAWTLVFDVAMNGYPVLLQRYNRALLHRRFAVTAVAPT